MTWRQQANAVILPALRKLPIDMPLREKRKALNALYPFGIRQYHPYKIWLSALKEALREPPPPHTPAPLVMPDGLKPPLWAKAGVK